MFCTNCGTRLDGNSKFCIECGTCTESRGVNEQPPKKTRPSAYKAWVLFLFALALLWTLGCGIAMIGALFASKIDGGLLIGSLVSIGIGLTALVRTATALGWMGGND